MLKAFFFFFTETDGDIESGGHAASSFNNRMSVGRAEDNRPVSKRMSVSSMLDFSQIYASSENNDDHIKTKSHPSNNDQCCIIS